MLPYYIIIVPLWLAIAIVLPLVQTLHALQKQSDDRKIWLFYWCLYCAASFVLYYFEWLVSIPFFVLSFYVDIYYEAQLALLFYLVFPKFLGIRQLLEFVEAQSEVVKSLGAEHVKDLAKIAYDKFIDVTKKEK
eukprot:gb/GFBE01072300.1/.p1 GENE.gb/GFBE01072300.1/~~gb/GFBE01072300.1/.p1  ORF type:complete len:134 (+),score=39.11 gb/GFBE01072300.1/:1-402(+)